MSGKRRAAGSPVTRSSRRPAKRTWRSRLRGVLKWGLVGGLVLALLVAGAFVYLYRTIEIPNENAEFLTETTHVYYDDGKTELGQFAIQHREKVTLAEIPDTVEEAVVAAENRTFWTDRGIDPKGILRAAFSNASGGTTQGASTITQQYVKILYLTQERSLTRKVKEAILSLKIQRQQSKREILEGYLNTIYFGRGAYGVQAAAEAYFGKPVDKLDLRESVVLAAVLNNPGRYDPAGGKQARAELELRYDSILEGMADIGSISSGEAARAERRLPKFPKIAAEDAYGGQRGHMLRLVRDQLHRLGFSDEQIDGGGLRVTTTLDPKVMEAAKQGVVEARPEGFGDKQLHIGVASVEPGTGALRGFYGGQDFLDSEINWAVSGGMVGSTFKPFTLATALSAGFSLKDTFQGNSPYEFPDGLTVRNEGTGSDGLGNDYGSSIDAVTALEQSVNTAFVDMSASIPNGPEKILAMAKRLGVPPTKPDKDYPGIPDRSIDLEADALITLGKARISPINLANAYATIGNGGVRAEVHVIDKVVAPSGEVLYRFKAATEDVLDTDIAADVTYAMQQVVRDGTGQAALALGRPVAGKTGTATNDKDQVSSAWFAGMTPQLATAVMYVRGDGDDQLDGWLPSYFGADYPADTWTAVMSRAMEGVPVEEFPPPAFVDGEAPEEGHAPYVPPPPPSTSEPAPAPQPTKEPKPSKRPTRQPTTEAPPPPPPSTSEPPPPPPPPTTSEPPPPPTPTDPISTTPGGGPPSDRPRRRTARR